MPEFKLLLRVYPGKKNIIKRDVLKHSIICFKKFGIPNTSMSNIQQNSKYSLRTIYNHCSTKEDIVSQLVIAAMHDLHQYRQKYLLDASNFEECIYALVLSYLDWIEEHPHFSQILLSETYEIYSGKYSEKIKLLKNEHKHKIYKWISLPENKQGFNPNIPEELYPSIINGIPEHYGKYWHLKYVKNSPKTYKKNIALIVWNIISNYCENNQKTKYI